MINDAFMRLHGTSANPPVPSAPTTLTTNVLSYSTFYMDLAGNVPTSGTNPNTNGLQYRDIGEGTPLYCVVTIVQAFSATTSMSFEVIAATNTAGTTGVVVLGTTGVVLLANLTAGKQFVFPLASNIDVGPTAPRYLQGRMLPGTNDVVNGTFFMDIVTEYSDSKKFYASGFAVS